MTRTFFGPDLESALAKVRAELGSDAIVVSSRVRVSGGVEVGAVSPGSAPIRYDKAVPPPRANSLLARLLAQAGLDPLVAGWLLDPTEGAERTLREAFEALARALELSAGLFVGPAPSGRRVLAFVGSPGVGKTTTLAKVAAGAALVNRRRTGIISLDGYRVGAAAQIEQFADLIGLPLEIATDAPSLGRALRRLADAELVLVDTAGRSRRDIEANSRLAGLLHKGCDEMDVTLCIAATERPDALRQLVDHYRVLRPGSLSITKIDEAACPDVPIRAHLESGLPLEWLSTGQRVPEDIERADARRLAAALIGEEIYR